MTNEFRDILALKKESLQKMRIEMRAMLEPVPTEKFQHLTQRERAAYTVLYGATRIARGTIVGLLNMVEDTIGNAVKDGLIDKMNRQDDDE